MPGSPVNYVDKDAFYKAIVAYKKQAARAEHLGKPRPKIPDYIGECLMFIARGVGELPRYNRYTFLDQMISDAVENSIRYFHNFDVDHPSKNPFGYFTQYCLYAFHRRIWKEKTELYTRYKMIQQSGTLDEEQIADQDDNGEEFVAEPLLYDNINDFIKKFEDKLKRDREKNRKPRGVEQFVEESGK